MTQSRILQNSDAMVQTDDGFVYRYSIDRGQQGTNKATLPSQLGGWSASSAGGEVPAFEGGNGDDPSISTWAVALMLTGFMVVFFGWCLYTVYVASKSSQQSPRLQAVQQNESSTTEKTELTRKERKARLLAYFERSGNQMEVQEANLVSLKTETGDDIEQGVEGNKEQGSDPIDGYVEENEQHGIILLVTKKIKLPKQQQEAHNNSGENNNLTASMDQANVPCSPSTSVCGEMGETLIFSSALPCSNDQEEGDKGAQHCPSSSVAHYHRQQQQQRQQHQVMDACAICLDPYHVGETVVWSDTCPHVFHKECFVEYLLSHRGKSTPCPSCRQTYCDESVFCLTPHEMKGGDSSREDQSVVGGLDEEAPQPAVSTT